MFKYELLEILEFNANRRRMSVIVRDLQMNQIMLLCKGAESAIFKCCVEGEISKCDANVKQFAQDGYRTLALAYKLLNEKEFQMIAEKIKKAYGNIIMRNTMLAQAFDEIEQQLILVGATAVEDKLQEKVSETIEFMREGGIKVWVLTGDKMETAINISNSCKHFDSNMIKMELTEFENMIILENKIEVINSSIR